MSASVEIFRCRPLTSDAAHPTVAATGRTVHHLFTGRLVAENSQITHVLIDTPEQVFAEYMAHGGEARKSPRKTPNSRKTRLAKSGRAITLR
jgi:hypothetical protein